MCVSINIMRWCRWNEGRGRGSREGRDGETPYEIPSDEVTFEQR